MIRGFFYKFNRSFKNLKNVIFHVKLLPPALIFLVCFAVINMGGVDKTGIRRMKSTHVLTGFNSERFSPVLAILLL